MFIFRVQGFAGSPGSYFSDSPIDVTVFAENEDEAIGKVEAASGRKLSGIERKIVAKEVAPHHRSCSCGQMRGGVRKTKQERRFDRYGLLPLA